jgi:hypothetical protein
MLNRARLVRLALAAAFASGAVVAGAGTASAQSPDDLIEQCLDSPFAPVCESFEGGEGDEGDEGDGGEGEEGTPLDALLDELPLEELEGLLAECRQLEALHEDFSQLCDALEDLAGAEDGTEDPATEQPAPAPPVTDPPAASDATPIAAGVDSLPRTGGPAAPLVLLAGGALAAGALGVRRLVLAR